MPVSTRLILPLPCLLATFACADNGPRDGMLTFFGSASESSTSEGDGDGDPAGGGDGDPSGDGDGDPSGDGDGDTSGDGDGDTGGDGDGDGDTGDGDGDPGDGDGDPADCAPGEVLCGGGCIDPLTDMSYCGAVADCLGANAGVICDPTPASLCEGALGDSCQAGTCATACPSGMEGFGLSEEIEEFVLPECVVELHVYVAGAQGGSSPNGGEGGLGAAVEGDVCVPPGTTLSVLVGGQAEPAVYPAGGGGGSYLADGQTPLFVAGGGGGCYHSGDGGPANQLSQGGLGVRGGAHNDGGGGGGFSTDGAGTLGSGGVSFLNGGDAGVNFPLNNGNTSYGGFGGGGGSSQSGTFNAAGGGGYDGGSAGNGSASTGGTSYMHPDASNGVFTPSTRAGDGAIEISW